MKLVPALSHKSSWPLLKLFEIDGSMGALMCFRPKNESRAEVSAVYVDASGQSKTVSKIELPVPAETNVAADVRRSRVHFAWFRYPLSSGVSVETFCDYLG